MDMKDIKCTETVTNERFQKIVWEAIEYQIYTERLDALCKKHGIPQEEIDAVYK